MKSSQLNLLPIDKAQPLTAIDNLDKNLIRNLFRVFGVKEEDIVIEDALNINLQALRTKQDDCECDDENNKKQTVIQQINAFLKKEFQKILDAIPPLDEITEDDIGRLLDEIINFLNTLLKTDLNLKNEEKIKEGLYDVLQLVVKIKNTVSASALVGIIKTLVYLDREVFGGRIEIILQNLFSLIYTDIRLLVLIINIIVPTIQLLPKIFNIFLGLFPPNLAIVFSIINLIIDLIFYGVGLVRNIGTGISYAVQIVRSLFEIFGALVWIAQNVTVEELENALNMMLESVKNDPFVKAFREWLTNTIGEMRMKVQKLGIV